MPPSLPERYNSNVAKKFLSLINVTNLSSDPVSATDGDIYYNTATDKLKVYANSAWIEIGGGGGGVTSITGTANEIDVSASTGAITISLPATINADISGNAATVTNGALTTGKLSQFASTTSSELAGVISDETGSGSLVFASGPSLTGVPTAPTAAILTNTTQIATTEFVNAEIANDTVLKTGGTFTGTVSGVSPTAVGSSGFRNITMSTSAPTGGSDGDVWLLYT